MKRTTKRMVICETNYYDDADKLCYRVIKHPNGLYTISGEDGVYWSATEDYYGRPYNLHRGDIRLLTNRIVEAVTFFHKAPRFMKNGMIRTAFMNDEDQLQTIYIKL